MRRRAVVSVVILSRRWQLAARTPFVFLNLNNVALLSVQHAMVTDI